MEGMPGDRAALVRGVANELALRIRLFCHSRARLWLLSPTSAAPVHVQFPGFDNDRERDDSMSTLTIPGEVE